MNEYINITLENLETEHLCCAISDKKHQEGVQTKREWLKDRIKEGYVFRKLNAKGKVFIEYAPLETAWTPVTGTDYLYIYCLWVAGSYKGNHYGKELLEYAIEDAKKQNKNGLCTLVSKKKKPYLGEKNFFLKYGFQVVDTIGDYELLALSFHGEVPKFCDSARKMEINNQAFTIYYSPQCPFVQNCIQEVKAFIKETDAEICFEKIDSLKKAKNAPCIFNNWANFKDGKFLSNQLLNKNLIAKLLK
ncbi:MAG: GNAT family N-acetyltransferase [Firmicutes bacterium]|nr:GNAT family N-acetyltransferase [Bacillota bacterium]